MDTTRMLGPAEGYEPEVTDGDAEGQNPLLTLHLLLKGRYWLAGVAAVVLGVAGAMIGYKVTVPTYACTGTIHIVPVIQSPLLDKNGTMPMYDSFVATQMEYLKSQEYVDAALDSDTWRRGGKRQATIAVKDEFRQHLQVWRSDEMVHVTYTDPDYDTAQDGVQALMDAYQLRVKLDDPDHISSAEVKFNEKKQAFEELQKKIKDLVGDSTPEMLSQSLETMRLAVTDAQIAHLRVVREIEEMQQRNEAATQPAATEPAMATGEKGAVTQPISPEEAMAKWSPDMRALLKDRTMKTADLLAAQSKYPPRSQYVIQAQAELDQTNGRIESLLKHPELFKDGTDGNGAPDLTLGELKEREKRYKEDYDNAYAHMNELAKKVSEIHDLQAQEQLLSSPLDTLKSNLDEMKQISQGRIQLKGTERPALRDRRKPIAGAAAFGGGAMGFALIALLGLTDRRLRNIDQARMSLQQGMKVLGMLPSLPKNLADPSAASFAALCVHHIRMLLQVMPRLDGHPAIAVTSPSPGDGKTSLTLALALSYAASGKSTLIIDCDIVGAGLTRRVNAIIRRRIGQILIRENLITATELREALSSAQRSGRKLGEVLVEEGYVEAEQLNKALRTQVETSVGLLDVLRGEPLEDCVAEAGTPRLWVLPVGSAQAEHGATISPEGFRSILEQARKRFEVILIDTGPIPGSIESSVAASQADGTILTVSRGEQGGLVRRASDHLRDVGARALGIVFNRATTEDFSSSYGAVSSPSIPERIREKPGTDMAQLGPVAAAVAGQKPKEDGGEKAVNS